MSIIKDKYYFHTADYLVFGSMLLLSALTGLYFGCRRRVCTKKGVIQEDESLRDYLSGAGSLSSFPVAMSLVASYISGVTMLGTPAEIYNFGTHYWLITFAIWGMGAVVAFVYVPVFFKLQVCSSYEYLELRFSSTVRTMASIFFILDEIMFLPMIIYVPSLAFNQVTGINLHLIGTIVCIICIFYTVLGGLKAVVYTDTWQTLTMFVSMVIIVILGIIAVGGFDAIIELNKKGKRIGKLNFNPSLYERYTFWNVLIGGFVYWTAFNSVNQTMVQRYMSLPTLGKSQISVLIFTIGTSLFVSLCCFSGILVYSKYYDCDPLTAGLINADDQLLPLYVTETVGYIWGIPGLFIAGVFGAALSSLSVVLNSTALVFLEDCLKGLCNLQLSEKRSKLIVRIVVVTLGVISIAFMYVIEYLGGVLAVATALSAISAGSTFGVFTLGMLFPWSNTKGAIAGAISGALTSGSISYGMQYVSAMGMVKPRKLEMSVDQCFEKYGIAVNATIIEYPDESIVFPLFRLSYFWVTPIGVVTVLTVGLIVSFLTGKTDIKKLDPELISPVSQWLLPAEAQQYAGSTVKNARHRNVEGDGVGLTALPESRTRWGS